MKAIVLTLRGCHLGFLGCYGNLWISTPALDRLATEGVVFDQHFADNPDPDAARQTWRTGCYHFPNAAPASPPDLLALLRQREIPTVLLVDTTHPVAPEWRQGWTQIEELRGDAEGTLLEYMLAGVSSTLDDLAHAEHWLLWLDLGFLLPPWSVPDEYLEPYLTEPMSEEEEIEDQSEEEALLREAADPLQPWFDPPTGFFDPQDDDGFLRLQSTCAGAVSYLDAALGLLLAELDKRQLTKECLLVVTSDSGQALGEHGVVGPHRPWLHEEVVHLPLLMRLPHSLANPDTAMLRVAALTQTVDLMPTLLEAFGIARPPAVHGMNLLALAREQPGPERAYVCQGWQIGAAREWALRTHDAVMLYQESGEIEDPAREVQYFVKPDDRWEVNEVRVHHLDRVDQYRQVLDAFLEQTRHRWQEPHPLLGPPLPAPVEETLS